MVHLAHRLAVLMACMAMQASAATLYVDPSGSGTTCSENSPCVSLSAAFSSPSIAEGDTISVAAGTYEGSDNCGLTPPINSWTLVGAGSDNTAIDCGLTDRVFNLDYEAAATEHVISISDITIRNGAPDGHAFNRQSGGAFYLRGWITMTVEDSVIDGNQGYYGGALSSNAGDNGPCVVTFRRCSFNENISRHGGVSNGDDTTQLFEDCDFTANVADDGGVMYGFNDMFVTFRRCTMTNNVGTKGDEFCEDCDGGAIKMYSMEDLVVEDCTFEGNTSPVMGGAISVRAGRAAVSNSVFRANTGTGEAVCYGGGAIAVYSEGELTLEHCELYNNAANTIGGGVLMEDVAVGVITNCTFEGNTAKISGGLHIGTFATLEMTESTLRSNVAKESAGGMTINNQGPVTITDTLFDSNECTYSASVGGGIVVEGVSSPEFTGCTISNNVAVYGGGVAFLDDCSPKFTECTFDGNVANATLTKNPTSAGGAVYESLESSASPLFTKSTFTNNYADFGGAIYNALKMDVQDATLSGNEAIYGGAMYMASADCMDEALVGNLTGNVITANNAVVSGGGVAWANSNPCDYELEAQCLDCTIADNAAEGYGADLSGPISELNLASATNQFQDSVVGDDGVSISVAPSQVFSVVLRSVDRLGQAVDDPISPNKVVLSIENNSGAGASPSIFAADLTTFLSAGEAHFVDLRISGDVGVTYTLVFQIEFAATLDIVKREISVPLTPCPPGTAFSGSECVACAEGRYNLVEDGTCLACPEGALCPGGVSLLAKPNYWRGGYEDASPKFYRCSVGTCCTPESRDGGCTMENQCADNRPSVGNNTLCGLCDDDHTVVGNTCVECPEPDAGAISLGAIILFFFVFVILVVPKSATLGLVSDLSPLVKIFVTYTQIAFLLFDPRAAVFEFISFFLFTLDWLPSTAGTSCLFPLEPLENVVAGYLLPLLLMSVLAIEFGLNCFWMLLCKRAQVLRRAHKKMALFVTPKSSRTEETGQLSIHWPYYTYTLLFLVLLSYMPIAKTSLDILVCRQVYDFMGDGGWMLAASPSVKCYEGNHVGYAVLASFLLAFSIGFPPLLYSFTKKKWNDKKDGTTQQRYYMIWNAFRQDMYWYTSFDLARKLVLTATAVLVEHLYNDIWEMLGLSFELAALTVCLFLMRPWRNEWLNTIDCTCHVSLLCIAALQVAVLYLSISEAEANLVTTYQILQAFMLFIPNVPVPIYLYYRIRNWQKEMEAKRLDSRSSDGRSSYSEDYSDGSRSYLSDSTRDRF